MTTVTLWALWKCQCNRLYDAVDIRLSDVLLEIQENLLAVVRVQYDNMHGSPRDCEREKEKASSLMEKVAPVYSVNSRASMALSTSMHSFLNINRFHTFNKV